MVNGAGVVNADTVITNTVSPKDLTAYDGQSVDLTYYRYIYKGWNTIFLPVSLTEAELNEIFGEECRLETLVGVENNVVKVRLQGACGHCPGAIMTLRGFVLKVLQEEIPSIEDVVNVQ